MKKIIVGALTTIVFLASAVQSFAVDCSNADPCGTIDCPATIACIASPNGLFAHIWQAALALVGVVAVILIIVSGYKYITSGGDSKQVEDARKTLSYAIIGLVVILFSSFIIVIISTITGVKCIQVFGLSVTGCQ